MKIIGFSIGRPVTIIMLMTAMLLFGFIAFSRLPINLLPDITYPTLTVRTEYVGAAPNEIENLISEPIEEAVGVVTGVVRVSSISRPERSDVILEFEWGTNMDFASLNVREKIDLLNLPQAAEKPILLRFDPSLDPILRIALSGNESLTALRIMAEEEIKRELEALEGVAAVKISGGLEEEIHVELDESRLASLGIPITQVATRLEQENVNLAGGTIKDGETEYLVRILNEFQAVDEIGDIIVGQVNTVPILLSDVASVTKSHKERKLSAQIDGRESIEIAIYKEAGTNTIQVGRVVKDRLNSVQETVAGLTSGVNLEVVFDQSIFIEQSVDEVLKTALYGGILAILVLYLFLRSSSSLIIGVSIPISVVTTFFFLYAFDVSLNIMSLGGLALGVGMLVDNSIVVLEGIDRHRRRGGDQPVAERVRLGASEVGQAVVAATLTTVCVFVPIVFVEGIAGQLFRDLALAVTFSLIVATLVAVTLIPGDIVDPAPRTGCVRGRRGRPGRAGSGHGDEQDPCRDRDRLDRILPWPGIHCHGRVLPCQVGALLGLGTGAHLALARGLAVRPDLPGHPPGLPALPPLGPGQPRAHAVHRYRPAGGFPLCRSLDRHRADPPDEPGRVLRQRKAARGHAAARYRGRIEPDVGDRPGLP